MYSALLLVPVLFRICDALRRMHIGAPLKFPILSEAEMYGGIEKAKETERQKDRQCGETVRLKDRHSGETVRWKDRQSCETER